MFSNKMSYSINEKILLPILILSSFVLSFAFIPPSFAATKPVSIKVMGEAKFVLRGIVTAVATDSLTLHVTNTSKNAKLFDNKDKTFTLGKNTKITKSGRIIYLKDIKSGNTIKVFGIFDKKSGAITLIRWIKVIPAQNTQPPNKSQNQAAPSPAVKAINPPASAPISTPAPSTPAAKSFTVHANDNSADLTTITVNKGTPVQLTFSVDAEGTYHGGLDFRSSAVSTGTILPGSSKTINFTANSSFAFTPYWPSTSIQKPYTINVVVQ